ncbi:MAG: hypothetical protein E6Q84_03325 [Thiothrix sp.]|nr:MAG: hypothetical protein E6Q84_03325 [Thiothrix sp.]
MRRFILLAMTILLVGCGQKIDNTPEAKSSRFFVQKALENLASPEIMAAAQQCQYSPVPECEQLKEPLQVIADRFQGCADNPTTRCQEVMMFAQEYQASGLLPKSEASAYPLHPFYLWLHSDFNEVSNYRSEIAVYWFNNHRTSFATLAMLLGLALLWGILQPWLSRRSQTTPITAPNAPIPVKIPQPILEDHLEQKRLETALKARKEALSRKRTEGLKRTVRWKQKKAEKLQRLEEQECLQKLKSDLEGLL